LTIAKLAKRAKSIVIAIFLDYFILKIFHELDHGFGAWPLRVTIYAEIICQ